MNVKQHAVVNTTKLSMFIAVPVAFVWIFVGGIAYQHEIDVGDPDNALGMFIMAFPLGIIYCIIAMVSVMIPYGIVKKFLNNDELDAIDYAYLLSM